MNCYQKYLNAEIKEIEIHKWIESEKVGYDLGNEAVIDWIKNHAPHFIYQYHSTFFDKKTPN